MQADYILPYLYGLEVQEGGGAAVCSITPNLLKALLDLLYSTHDASPVTRSDAPPSQSPLLLEIGQTINCAYVESLDTSTMSLWLWASNNLEQMIGAAGAN